MLLFFNYTLHKTEANYFNEKANDHFLNRILSMSRSSNSLMATKSRFTGSPTAHNRNYTMLKPDGTYPHPLQRNVKIKVNL